jgi:hypothetical protein
VETAIRRQALSVAARAVEQRLNADLSDYAGPHLPCPGCGNAARYVDRHNKTIVTALGDLTLSRAYYSCAACQAGFCPRDQALGFRDGSLSPAVTRMVAKSAALVSFVESSRLLAELAGLQVDAKQVERTSETLGREIAQDEMTVVEVDSPCAPRMYLGMDGAGIPVRRAELEGRPGKQADGSAKTREVKLVTVWNAEGRDDEGIPVRDEGSISYSAAAANSQDTSRTSGSAGLLLRSVPRPKAISQICRAPHNRP